MARVGVLFENVLRRAKKETFSGVILIKTQGSFRCYDSIEPLQRGRSITLFKMTQL